MYLSPGAESKAQSCQKVWGAVAWNFRVWAVYSSSQKLKKLKKLKKL